MDTARDSVREAKLTLFAYTRYHSRCKNKLEKFTGPSDVSVKVKIKYLTGS